jgi:hypothetical protein
MKQKIPAIVLVSAIIGISFLFAGVAITTLPANERHSISMDNTNAPRPEDSMTPSQQEAVKSARGYLDATGFSKRYLTNWLVSYEKFSREDAEYAIAYLNPNWNEEAVRTAQTYIDADTGITREYLLDQLAHKDGDGYTKSQATYAVDKVMPR